MNAIAVGASGSVYTTGYYSNPADFDPGPGTYNIPATGMNDVFISKVDAAGQFVWVKHFGVQILNRGNAIAVDAAENIYTVGYVDGTTDFDPGPDVFTLPGPGMFILKLDSSGNFIWAKRCNGSVQAVAMTLDAQANIYVTGQFLNAADFDPGPATYNLTSTSYSQDFFICKLDSAGSFGWAIGVGGPGYDDKALAITTDTAGNVYTTGYFVETADFDPGPGVFNLTATTFRDMFILKVNSSGQFSWAKRVDNADGNAIAVDNAGNVYSTGIFVDSGDFDPGPAVYNLTSTGDADCYLLKLDAGGNFVWAKRFGGSNYDESLSLKLDRTNNLYLTGSFSGTADLDPGTATYNVTSQWYRDIFLSKIDSSGNLNWGVALKGDGSEIGTALALDSIGNVYSTGQMDGTVDFDPSPGLYNLSSAGGTDIYLLKLTLASTLPVSLVNFNATTINNNMVELKWLVQQEHNIKHYIIERSTNGRDYIAVRTLAAAGNPALQQTYSAIDEQPSIATNYYRLKIIDDNGSGTYSKVAKVEITKAIKTVVVYPNPAKIFIHAIFDNNVDGNIQITNETGIVVKKQRLQLFRGVPYSINLAGLSPGKYYLTMSSQNKKEIVEFIKMQ